MIDYRSAPTGVQETKRRYKEMFPGWSRLDKRACPRGLLGEWCPNDHQECGECSIFRGTGPLDHCKVWRTPDGETVLTGEPYHLDGGLFARFVEYCRGLGLTVEVGAYSPYYPCNTLLVTVKNERSRLMRHSDLGDPFPEV